MPTDLGSSRISAVTSHHRTSVAPPLDRNYVHAGREEKTLNQKPYLPPSPTKGSPGANLKGSEWCLHVILYRCSTDRAQGGPLLRRVGAACAAAPLRGQVALGQSGGLQLQRQQTCHRDTFHKEVGQDIKMVLILTSRVANSTSLPAIQVILYADPPSIAVF